MATAVATAPGAMPLVAGAHPEAVRRPAYGLPPQGSPGPACPTIHARFVASALTPVNRMTPGRSVRRQAVPFQRMSTSRGAPVSPSEPTAHASVEFTAATFLISRIRRQVRRRDLPPGRHGGVRNRPGRGHGGEHAHHRHPGAAPTSHDSHEPECSVPAPAKGKGLTLAVRTSSVWLASRQPPRAQTRCGIAGGVGHSAPRNRRARHPRNGYRALLFLHGAYPVWGPLLVGGPRRAEPPVWGPLLVGVHGGRSPPCVTC